MKLIGIEEHFLTAEIRDAWHAIALEAVGPSVGYCADVIEQRLIDFAQGRIAHIANAFSNDRCYPITMGSHHWYSGE
jgi:hypothetical protein